MATALVLTLRDEDNKRYPPQHWLNRAQETREMAQGLKDPGARSEMEMIARLYEKLAEFAERWLSGRKAD
jgi:hypothetical protein